MVSFAFVSSLLAVVATVAAQTTTLTVNTPASLVQCQPAALAWSGGKAPYFLAIIPSGTPGTILENLGQINGTSYTWNVNLAAGTLVALSITDSSGGVNYSSGVNINAGTSSACVGAAVSTAAGAGATSVVAAASSAAKSASSAAASSAASTSASSTASSAASSATTAAAKSGASQNGAALAAVAFGVLAFAL